LNHLPIIGQSATITVRHDWTKRFIDTRDWYLKGRIRDKWFAD